jgi:hypothetical protein
VIQSEHAKLVYAHGQNYWYIPDASEDLQAGIFVPVGQESILELDELGTWAEPAGFVISSHPLRSSPVERMQALPASGRTGLTTGPVAGTNTATSMADYVP